jgi:hypothetical protein
MAGFGEYGYDTERNNYPLKLLNEDIERMINTDTEFIDAINDLKAAMEKEYYERMINTDAVDDLKAGVEKEYYYYSNESCTGGRVRQRRCCLFKSTCNTMAEAD